MFLAGSEYGVISGANRAAWWDKLSSYRILKGTAGRSEKTLEQSLRHVAEWLSLTVGVG